MNAPPLSIWKPAPPKQATSAKDILAHVCKVHACDLVELRGQSRVKKLVRARMHAFHALRGYGMTLHQIGTLLNRDHTTVLCQANKWPKFAAEYR